MRAFAANGWKVPADLGAVDGIAFRRDGAAVRTRSRALIKPIDQLPWPARERRDLDGYFRVWRERHGGPALSMVTSRGCPFHCSWCSKQVYGDTYRRRSVDDVIDELVDVKARYQPDQIWFADDLFTINRKWVHRFSDAMVSAAQSRPSTWWAGPRRSIPQCATRSKRAGCYRVYCSAESGAQHVLDAMHKDSKVTDILRAGRYLRAAGIELGCL